MNQLELRDRLGLRFVRRLVSTAKGRAHLLNQLADAESNGEADLFERALAHVDDAALRKLIEKHQADEIRHARLFSERRDATGVPTRAVPLHLRLIDRLNAAADGVLDEPIVDRLGVMKAYLMLQVLEERAMRQFPVFEAAFREIDTTTADILVEIMHDEERHLKYCQAIAKRYAPDQATLDDTLANFRAIEAQAFAENSRANLDWVYRRGIFQASAVEKAVWWLLTAIMPATPAVAPAATTQHATPIAA
jgi:rubrerythrin